MTRHSATGRADLLRALAQGVESPLALDAGESGWFGYRQRPKRVVPIPTIELHVQPVVPTTATPAPEAPNPDRRQPLQMETIWAVVERTSVSTEATDEAPGEVAVQPITEEEARGLDRIVDYEDLIPWARLTPVLRCRLSQPRRGGIDLKRLCWQVANQRPLKQLPRQVLSRWHPDIVVALDFSPRLWPYRWDMHRLCEQLRRHCGRTGLSLRLLAHGPWGGWTEWLTDEEADLADSMAPQVWTQPPAGARLLVVGDLGALSPDASLRAQWRDWVQHVQAAGVRVEALLPLGADQLPAELAGLLPTIRWSPDSHLRPESGSQRAGADFADGSGDPVGDSLHDLLAQVASLRRVDPPLLRALRRALPHQHGNAGLEGAVWSHPDVEVGIACTLRPEAAPRWQQHLRSLPRAVQQELQSLRRRHHQHLRAALRHEEVLLAETHSAAGTVNGAELGEATAFMEQLAHWVTHLPTQAVPEGWQGFAEDAVRRVDAQTAKRFESVFTRLLAADLRARRVGTQEQVDLPVWADAARVQDLLAPTTGAPPRYWIVEHRPTQVLRLQPRPPSLGERALALPFEAWHVTVQTSATSPQRISPLRGQYVHLCGTLELTTMSVQAGGQAWRVAPVRRPRGVEGWGLQPGHQGISPRVWITRLDGVEAELPGPWNFGAAVVTDVDRRYHLLAGRQADTTTTAAYGMDAYGLFADMNLAGTPQRLRHLPPGRFLMGSPATEPGRFYDEGPQHEVALTRGFWLADTCCTQALWQAVMGGKNPSHFTGDPTLPVDSVSWDDVQTFLGRLQQQLPPGVEAVLPTEAQWEYACRAGSQTPYSFGDTLTPEQANFVGKLGKTVPVKSLPANPWRLYEMHGNLLEWCSDAQRKYTAEPVEDPDGGQDGVSRVLRGGAWRDVAGRARSAHRDVSARDDRDQLFGFRFALRSIEPGAGGGISGRAEPARVLPQVEPGAGVGPAEPGPRAEGIWSRVTGLFKGRK